MFRFSIVLHFLISLFMIFSENGCFKKFSKKFLRFFFIRQARILDIGWAGKLKGYRYRSSSDSISLSVLQSKFSKKFQNFLSLKNEERSVSDRQTWSQCQFFWFKKENVVLCWNVFGTFFLCSKFFFCFFSIACSNCLPRRLSGQWARHATDSSLYHRSKEFWNLAKSSQNLP